MKKSKILLSAALSILASCFMTVSSSAYYNKMYADDFLTGRVMPDWINYSKPELATWFIKDFSLLEKCGMYFAPIYYDSDNYLLESVTIINGGIAKLQKMSAKYDKSGQMSEFLEHFEYSHQTVDNREIYSYLDNGLIKTKEVTSNVSYNNDNPSKQSDSVVNYEYTYDSYGRPITYGNSSWGLSFEYDNKNRIIKVINDSVHLISTYSYDRYGNVTFMQEEVSGNNSKIESIRYTYDRAGNIIKIGETEFPRDDKGQLLDDLTYRYSYNENGLISERKMHWGDGFRNSYNVYLYKYYDNGKVKQITRTWSEPNDSRFVITLDENGNVAKTEWLEYDSSSQKYKSTSKYLYTYIKKPTANTANSTGVPANYTGWTKNSKGYQYWSNGTILKNRWLKTKNGSYYYVDSKGYRVTGWYKVSRNGGVYSYFDKNGIWDGMVYNEKVL